MKLLFSIFACSLLASLSFAETPVTRDEAGKIKTYDLAELNALLPETEGKTIKVKFTYRGESAEKLDDGSLRSVIRYVGRNGSGGVIPVRVPKEAAPWFLKLPYGSSSRQTLFVFAKINKTETGTFAELLGREMRTDTKGPKIIW